MERGVFCEVTLEVMRFERAAAGEILGVKIKHDPFAAIILQVDRAAITTCKADFGSDCTWGWRRWLLDGPCERDGEKKENARNEFKLHGRKLAVIQAARK